MSGDQNAPHLAVISDRKALSWVLTKQRLAFPEPRFRSLFPKFKKGDTIYLYTSRGCFKNPTRDRGRVIGKAIVTTDLATNADPLIIRDRALPHEVGIKILSLAPVGEGPVIAELVPNMTTFPKPENWSIYLRRSVLALSERDAKHFDKLLTPFDGGLQNYLAGYQARGRMGVVGAAEAAS